MKTLTRKPPSRRAMEDKLRDLLDLLERIPCQFWACPGPNAPVVHMATCYACAELRSLRQFVRSIDEEDL